jgi:hypothetical protein
MLEMELLLIKMKNFEIESLNKRLIGELNVSNKL